MNGYLARYNLRLTPRAEFILVWLGVILFCAGIWSAMCYIPYLLLNL